MKPLQFHLLICVICVICGQNRSASAAEPQLITNREHARNLPLPKSDDVFHFAIYGDRTGGDPSGISILKQAVADTNLLAPDLVMTVGDLVEGISAPDQWMREMQEYRGVMDALAMPWYPVAGNHDIQWDRKDPNPPPGEFEGHYEKHFGPLWYAFEHKNAGFVILYTEEGDPAAPRKAFNKPGGSNMSVPQMSWLVETLDQLSHLDHIFVFLHHPRWIEQRYPDSNWPEVHRLLVDAGNVHAVFAGHIHFLHYTGPIDGIEYHALGATGANVPGGIESIELGIFHHLDIVTVRKDSFRVSTLPVGSVIDPKKFEATRQNDISSLTSLYKSLKITPLYIDAEGWGDGIIKLAFKNPSTRPIEIELTPLFDTVAWSFTPEKVRLTLQPGETADTPLAWQRKAAPNAGAPPELALSIDYLTEADRLTIPERILPLKITKTIHDTPRR